MAERGDQGFEVAPTRIGGSAGPSRSRRRISPVILILVLAVAVPAVAWVGPRIVWRPAVDLSFLQPTPTPLPTKTPLPTRDPATAPATPLPQITIGEEPRPTEPFAMDIGGLRLVDPATGALGSPLGLRVDTDAIFPAANGESWWCVCFVRMAYEDHEDVTVEIRQVDRSGRVLVTHTVGEFKSSAANSQDFWTRFDLEVAPDGRRGYLAIATRSGDEWSIVVQALDLDSGAVTASSDLGKVVVPPIEGPTPPPDQGMIENYLAGPFMRLSPDGRRLMLWAWMDAYRPDGSQQISASHGWTVDLDEPGVEGPIGVVTELESSFAERLRTCYWTAFVTSDQLAAVCFPFSGGSPSFGLEIFGSDGTERRHIDLGSMTSWIADPVLDRANRQIFMWRPSDHVLSRVDIDSGAIEEIKVDQAATGSGLAGSGSGSESGRAREWSTFTSDLRLYYGPQLLPEPGGNRLFALGVLPDAGYGRGYGVSGIFVFDADEVALLDRWSPLAAYGSLGLSPDNRWLFAIGSPGVTETGKPAEWESSLTVYDVSDGRPVLQLGRLGNDVQVMQVPP